jgi:hypothetical protein
MRTLALLVALTGCIGPQLDVAIEGDGEGAVNVDDGAVPFRCDETCALVVDGPIVLTPAARVGSTFVGWSGGGCSGSEPCTLLPSADITVTARFEITRVELGVALDGTGTGTVTSDDEGIRCGTDCAETYTEGSAVVLTASPSGDSTFAGWSGSCVGTSPTCTVAVGGAGHVVASFRARNPRLLTVTRSGAGIGSVTSSSSGINCGLDCTEHYDMGTIVTLTAMPGAHSMFAGWTGGGCSGTGTCTTTLAAAMTIDAAFALVPYALTVVPSGPGSGTVTSTPSGINCGTDCSEPFVYNSIVTLAAAASADSTFMGWSGGVCTGTGTCTLTIDQARAVSAVFKSNSATPFMCSSVPSMTTDSAGQYSTWIGAWYGVTANTAGEELGIMLPFDEPNTPMIESQYWYQRMTSPTPSVLAIGPSNGGYIPPQILTVVTNSGTLKVYMPSMTTNDCVRTRFYVGADGSTYHSRADHDYTYSAARANLPTEQCYSTWGAVGPDLTPAQAMVPQHLARAAP